jgi:hypothetical protein
MHVGRNCGSLEERAEKAHWGLEPPTQGDAHERQSDLAGHLPTQHLAAALEMLVDSMPTSALQQDLAMDVLCR